MPPSTSLLPPVPLRHGKQSKTFARPSLDGSITIPQIIDYNADYGPNHPLFLYDDGPLKVYITWSQVRRATERVSRIVRSYSIPSHNTASKCIGILAALDTITYFTLQHGIIRSGYIPFALSPRNSPAAVAHLLSKTNTTHVFVSGDPSMQALWAGTEMILQGSGPHTCQAIPTPFYTELYEERPEEYGLPFPPAPAADLNSVGLMLHSSGSTSFPKPIPILHRSMIEWARLPSYGEIDMCSMLFGAVALPMFHALGTINSHCMIGCGGILLVLKPEERPSFPSPERVIEGIKKTNVEVLFTLPSFLEAWSTKEEWVEVLKGPRAVLFSGGPLSKVVGDGLASAGVHLSQVYGLTEMGGTNVFLPKYIEPEMWEYFQFSGHIRISFGKQEDSDAVEFRALCCETHTPAGLNAKIDGEMGLSTNDLLMEHPTRKGWYTILGRADDQIMLSTGEKTNPGPLESIISKDPLVQGAVVFGRGKSHNGVLIAPASHAALDVTDKAKVAAYVDAIWPSVQLANKYAPSHSRLFKEMIIITKPEKPFTFTGKGSIRKSTVIKDYEEEIEALYKAVEEAATLADIKPPTEWTVENVFAFVRDVVTTVMENKIGNNDDIFQNGGDSLQATFMRNSIISALRQTKARNIKGEIIDTSTISAGFVYQSPTINLLSQAVYGLIDPSTVETSNLKTRKIHELQKFIDEYGSDLPIHEPTDPEPSVYSEVIVVTGTTGAMGTAILAQLARMSTVAKVYALNRRSKDGKDLHERQEESLIERGYDPQVVLESGTVELYEIDPGAGDLGLEGYVYELIRRTATTIIHTAWRVDFNLSVASFEPLFKGLRNLIDLSLSSSLPTPPKILFASSVSVLGTLNSDEPAVEAHIDDPTTVLNTSGYGESKWVAEQILARVAEKTPLKPVIVRIGQLSGGQNGSWNTSEWIPAVIKSGEVVRALPASGDRVSWLPMHVAASAIVDFRHTTSPVVHLSHPYPATWPEIFFPIARALRVPLVPLSQWLALLEKDLVKPSRTEVEAITANPVLHLIGMFRPFKGGVPVTSAREAMGVPVLSTIEAVKASPALRRENLKSLGREEALGWLKYWKKRGFIKSELYLGEKEPVTPTPIPAMENVEITEKVEVVRVLEKIAAPPSPKMLRNTFSGLTDEEVVARNAKIVKVASVLVSFTYLLSYI